MVSSLLSFTVAYLGAKSTGTFKLHLGEIKVITFLIDYIHHVNNNEFFEPSGSEHLWDKSSRSFEILLLIGHEIFSGQLKERISNETASAIFLPTLSVMTTLSFGCPWGL